MFGESASLREWSESWMLSPRKTLAKPPESPRKSPKSPSYIPIQIALIAAPKIAGRQQGIVRNPLYLLACGRFSRQTRKRQGSIFVSFL